MTPKSKLYLMLGAFFGLCVAGIYVLHVIQVYIAEPAQWTLPGSLREASGLAVASPTTVLTHNDENGKIYRFDLASGTLKKILEFGDKTVKDDFEGIEVVDDDVYLATSNGLLYHAPGALAGDRKTTSYNVIDTGLGHDCEIEGLVFDNGEFLFPCKKARTDKYKNYLTVFAWAPGSSRTSVRLSVSFASIGGRVHPSAIESDQNRYFIVAGREHVLIVIDKETLSVERIPLSPELHPQPEGISLPGDGSVVLVDEGHKKGLLTRYRSIDDIRTAG
jgi:uncharacterized protein YjiK